MPSAGFEPSIEALKRLQTYALDSTVNGIGRPAINFVLLFQCLFVQVGTYLGLFQSQFLSSSIHILASWEPVLVCADLRKVL